MWSGPRPPTPPTSTPPRWSRPTRTSSSSRPTSEASRPSTWTCGPSTTAPRPGSAPTCSSACSPPTWSGTCAGRGRRSASPTKRHPDAPTPSPPPAAPAPPSTKISRQHHHDGQPIHSSPPSSTNWPPSPATPSSSPAAPASPNSPLPPPSNASLRTHRHAHPHPTQPHVDRTTNPKPLNPLPSRGFLVKAQVTSG